MRFARFTINNHSLLGVDSGMGFFDYSSVLAARSIFPSTINAKLRSQPHFSAILAAGSVFPAAAFIDSKLWIPRLVSEGLLDKAAVEELLAWADKKNLLKLIDVSKNHPVMPHLPGKFVCIARNWEEHAKESGHGLPDRPVCFGKTGNCAIGPGETIMVSEEFGRIDHEGELGVVIGKRACRVKAEDAGDYIHSYTIINDITARDMQKDFVAKGWPWYAAKSMDSFAPFGPYLVTPDEAGPLEGQCIRVTVNGEIRQDGSIDDMHWKPPELIEAVTRMITLEPGDVLATGTPPGVGPLRPGDKVVVEIDGIGRLENQVGEWK